MRWKMVFVFILAFALVVLAGGCVKDSDIVGSWTLYFTWSGSTTHSTTITFYTDHTFYGGGYTGIWTLNGNKIRFELDTIVDTIYVGTVRSDGLYMSGTMSNNIPENGTWYAMKGLTASRGDVSVDGLDRKGN